MTTQVTLDMNRIPAYTAEQEQQARPDENFRPHIARMILKSIAEIKEGKGLSPVFDTADEMFDYLKKGWKKHPKKMRP
jgi:hypothetical protein